MAMIQNNKYIIAIFIVLIIPTTHAQTITSDDILKTKVWDWYIPPDFRPTNEYKESKKCGSISFDIPNWVDIKKSQLLIKKKLPHDNNPDFLSSGLTFSLDCKIQIDLNKDDVAFNTKTQQWELPSDIRNQYAQNSKYQGNKIYQIHAKNAFGWLYTLTNINTRDGGYLKQAKFCLFNDKKTKQLCGFGISQIIPNKKQLGTTRFDYTPILIKILNTAQFLDDK